MKANDSPLTYSFRAALDNMGTYATDKLVHGNHHSSLSQFLEFIYVILTKVYFVIYASLILFLLVVINFSCRLMVYTRQHYRIVHTDCNLVVSNLYCEIFFW